MLCTVASPVFIICNFATFTQNTKQGYKYPLYRY